MNDNDCFVCGYGPHAEGSHKYYPMAQAVQEFAGQPNAISSPEADYVLQHRPY